MLDCVPKSGSSSGCSFYSPIPHLTPIACLSSVKRVKYCWKCLFRWGRPLFTPSCKLHLATGLWQRELRSAGPTQHRGLSPGTSWAHVVPLPAEAHPGTAVLRWHWGDGPYKPLVSCVWQLYGDFEQVSQEHLHSCDRDIQPGIYHAHWPQLQLETGWHPARLWQKTRLLILLLSWNSFEAENIFMWYSTNTLLRFIKH